MIVSLANSLQFITENGLDPSIDNTLFNDEDFMNLPSKCYAQKFIIGETLLVQIKATLTETVTLKKVTSSAISTITATNTYTYSSFKIYNYIITISTDDYFYLKAESDADNTSISEPVKAVTRTKDLIKIEYYNFDPRLFAEFDYTNGEVSRFYIEAQLLDLSTKGDITVYNNQNEVTKVKQSLFRKMKLETNPIPRYLSFKIQLALAHDTVTLNDIQYTNEELGDIEPISKSNLTSFTADLTQRNVLALNTDDLGFNCDSVTTDDMVINLQKLDGSGQFSFTATAGYSINQIILKYQDGTSVTVKIGTTVGGEEILRETGILDSLGRYTIDREIALSRSSDTTIYVEVSGTNALCNVNIQTIKYIVE